MHWKTKSAAFRALSVAPFGASIHYALQRHVTREWPRSLTVLDELIVAAREILESARIGTELGSARYLEIGAGRDLAVAVALRMLGVGSVTTIDIDRLGRIDLVNHSASYMARQLGVAEPRFRDFDDLRAFGVNYLAPKRITEIAEGEKFDCFYSVDTLEHIPEPALREILAAARQRLAPDGTTVHLIDYSDHYARGGGSSRLNFLSFSDEDWQPHNSRFMYLNRLRHSEFLKLFENSGFGSIEAYPFQLSREEVQALELDARFRAMSFEDIATLRARVIARPE